MPTIISGNFIWSNDSPITENTLSGLPLFHPARKLLGAKIDWEAAPTWRMPGDDPFYPGVLKNGTPAMVSRGLQFYFST